MTSLLLHYNAEIFPSPTSFSPERWLDNPNLTKYLLAFSKGSRQCIGINLAYAELYLTLSRIFRSYGSTEVRHEEDIGVLELWKTDEKDVEIVGDAVIPLMAPESKGVRLKVLK